MSKKKTKEEFIEDARKVHGDKYNYSLVDYKGNDISVDIICPIHGPFPQVPRNHICLKNGCPDCSNNKKMTTETFIKKAKKIHGDTYDYSLVHYIKPTKNVTIICPIHGPFEQTPNNHLRGKRCKECYNPEITNEIFIKRCKEKHNNFYDYSLVEYTGSDFDVIIVCPNHGPFEQRAYNHMSGVGCPFCNESKGEKYIVSYLIKNNIKFNRQKKFDDCKNKRKLPFDFYLDDYNVCIEYDGIQHYQTVQRFGGYDNFIYTQQNDKIKTDYCLNNNIPLLRIKYTDIKKIKEIIDGFVQQIQ